MKVRYLGLALAVVLVSCGLPEPKALPHANIQKQGDVEFDWTTYQYIDNHLIATMTVKNIGVGEGTWITCRLDAKNPAGTIIDTASFSYPDLQPEESARASGHLFGITNNNLGEFEKYTVHCSWYDDQGKKSY